MSFLPGRSLSDAAERPPLRPLLPAVAPRSESLPSHSKRARVSLACAACRGRKTKCDGSRPQCTECATRNSACLYTETETTQVKRKHADIEALFELLKLAPEEEAQGLFRMIRAGTEPQDIMEQARLGGALIQLASRPALEGSKSRTSSLSVSAGEEIRIAPAEGSQMGSQKGSQKSRKSSVGTPPREEVRTGALQEILRGGEQGDQQ